MDGEKNIMAEGKSSSDFAAIVTSPHSEKAFSRALPAQKAPHEVGGLAEPARPEGLFPVCHYGAAKKSAVFLQKIAPQT